MQAHEILRKAIDILRLGWSQGASARDAGGVPVPLFTGDVAAVNPRAAKLSAYGAIVKAQYSAQGFLKGADWDLIYRRAAVRVPNSHTHPLIVFNDAQATTVDDVIELLDGCAAELEVGTTVDPVFPLGNPVFQEMKP